MKTLGRIFILSFVFVLLSGFMIMTVNASGMNTTDSDGDRAGQTEFRAPQGDEEGEQPFRPEEEREDFGGSRWIFGVVKDLGVIAIFVVAIVWPKSIRRKRRKLTS
jgi:hypothetical protein